MAYYATGSAADTDAFFQAARSHMAANHIVELDVISNSSGSRDIVFWTDPAYALQGAAQAIFRWTMLGGGQLACRIYSDWDPTAHAGMNEVGNTAGTTSISLQDTPSFTYYLRANPWSIGVLAVTSVNPNQHWYSGFLRRALRREWSGITKSSGAIASGDSTVNVTSDMRARMYVGQVVWLVNFAHNNASANKSRIARKIIQSISATSITFTTTVGAAFDAGTLIGENCVPGITMQAMGNTSSFNLFGNVLTQFHANGTFGSATAHAASNNYEFHGDNTVDDPGSSSANVFRWADIGVSSAISASNRGKRGIYHHFHGFTQRTAGNPVFLTDVMDDKVQTLPFLIPGHDTNGGTLFGPRN